MPSEPNGRALPAFGAALPDMPLRCICDRCKAEGVLDMPPFASLAGLLDFVPVPRRLRGDGWLPGLQKLFIAALAVTGSRNRAVKAVGKHNAGIENLRLSDGADSFNAAYDRALAIYEERHLARALGRVRALDEADGRQEPEVEEPLPPPTPARPTPVEWAAKRAALEQLLATKLESERRLRAQGKIADANLALRQLTRIEVMIELSATTEPATVDAFLGALRTASGVEELHVLDTAATRASDAERRAAWAEAAAAERPLPLPGPGDSAAEQAGITDRDDCRTWSPAVPGGPNWQLRSHQREVALLKRAFDGERE